MENQSNKKSKKKAILIILGIVLALILAIILIKVFASKGHVTIQTNSGNTEKMSIRELSIISHTDDVLFKNEYLGAQATIKGTIISIDIHYDLNGKEIVEIELGDSSTTLGIITIRMSSGSFATTNCRTGDKVKCIGTIGIWGVSSVYIIDPSSFEKR